MTTDLRKEIKAYLSHVLKRPAGSVYKDEGAASHHEQSKEEQLALLRQQFSGCTKCPLAEQGRAQVVFGEGDPHAALMFVGEGPGRDEDQQGRPFVGRAGKLLTNIINAMGLTREQVFISNTVKCRPPGNRNPSPEESRTCIDSILLREIAIVQPKIICPLGAIATRALLGDEATLAKTRGQIIQTEHFSVLPTYHPAYLLRNPPAKKFVWEDMQKIMAFLELPAQ